MLIGTYSTIYVAAPMLLHLHLRREPAEETAALGAGTPYAGT